MYYFNFLFLKISSCLMMYFCCRQRKFKCRDLKREQLHLLDQNSETDDITGNPFTFCLGLKNFERRHSNPWKLKKNVMEVPVLILNPTIFIAF